MSIQNNGNLLLTTINKNKQNIFENSTKMTRTRSPNHTRSPKRKAIETPQRTAADIGVCVDVDADPDGQITDTKHTSDAQTNMNMEKKDENNHHDCGNAYNINVEEIVENETKLFHSQTWTMSNVLQGVQTPSSDIQLEAIPVQLSSKNAVHHAQQEQDFHQIKQNSTHQCVDDVSQMNKRNMFMQNEDNVQWLSNERTRYQWLVNSVLSHQRSSNSCEEMTKVDSNDVTDEDFEIVCAPPGEEEWFHNTNDDINVDAWFLQLVGAEAAASRSNEASSSSDHLDIIDTQKSHHNDQSLNSGALMTEGSHLIEHGATADACLKRFFLRIHHDQIKSSTITSSCEDDDLDRRFVEYTTSVECSFSLFPVHKQRAYTLYTSHHPCFATFHQAEPILRSNLIGRLVIGQPPSVVSLVDCDCLYRLHVAGVEIEVLN